MPALDDDLTKRPTEKNMDQFEILEQIRERVLAAPDNLQMDAWHCGTSHCLAGWAQFIAGDMGAVTEMEGRRLIPAAAHLFFDTNEIVLDWLIVRAWNEENRADLHNALRARGVQVATGNEVVDWTGGDCWADGNATINQQASQTGGYCRAYGNATINQQASQTGGDCWADGNATINQQASQTGGDCRAYGNATINQQASQTGGYCWADGNATINQQASQTGGYCRAYGNATINQQASQTGGYCWAYGNATINQQASHDQD